MMFKKLMSTSEDPALTTLRLVLGVVFFAHGSQKLLGWFGGFGFHGTREFFASLGLITGTLTRIAASGVAAIMIGAIFMVHLPNGFFMNWLGNQKGEGYEFHLLALAIA